MKIFQLFLRSIMSPKVSPNLSLISIRTKFESNLYTVLVIRLTVFITDFTGGTAKAKSFYLFYHSFNRF